MVVIIVDVVILISFLFEPDASNGIDITISSDEDMI